MEGYDVPIYTNTTYPWEADESIKPGEVPEIFNPVASFTLAIPSPSAFIDTLSVPSSKVSLSVGTTDRSSTCAQGTAYKNTSLKIPENL